MKLIFSFDLRDCFKWTVLHLRILTTDFGFFELKNNRSNQIPRSKLLRAKHHIKYIFFIYFYLDHFADYCKLRGGVYFVDELPLTPSGKMLRRKVKEIAIQQYNARTPQIQ